MIKIETGQNPEGKMIGYPHNIIKDKADLSPKHKARAPINIC